MTRVLPRLLALLAGSFALAPAAAIPDRYSIPRDCDAPTEYQPVCAAPQTLTVAQAEAALGGRDEVAFGDGDTLTVIARRAAGPVTLCCTIQAPLSRIGQSDLWGLSMRVFHLERGVIDIQLAPAAKSLLAYYGAQTRRPPQVSRLLGSLVEEILQSATLGEARRLTIYLPPGYDKTRRYAVVYMADGATLAAYAPAIEAQIIAGRSRPLIVVGIWASERDPAARAREYLTGRSYARYRDHAGFVLDEVMPFAQARYGASDRREDRMLAGFSDGAAWALALGLRYPERFGHVAALSLGWPPAADGVGADNRPALFLAAGYLEPDFHATTARAARHALTSNAPLRFEEFASGHVLVAWQSMLLDALAWSFPRGPADP